MIIGIVIWKKVWKPLAPSIEAASYISRGTLCRPTVYSMTISPIYCHCETMITDHIAVLLSPNQSCAIAPSPIFSSTGFTKPIDGLYAITHNRPMAVRETTAGIKIITRVIDANLLFAKLLRRCAMISARPTWKTIDITAYFALFSKACQTFSSANSF